MVPKDQLIAKCPLRVFKHSNEPTIFFSRISALTSKEKSNQKSSLKESK